MIKGLWWIKTGLPGIKLITSNLGAPRMVPIIAHIEKNTFQVKSTGVVPAEDP